MKQCVAQKASGAQVFVQHRPKNVVTLIVGNARVVGGYDGEVVRFSNLKEGVGEPD